jgi:hypothetical protein
MAERVTFSLADYEALLQALKEAGYAFQDFESERSAPRGVIMRHDIDKSLAAALEIATVEEKHGVRSSYFFLLRSRMYNLAEPESVATVKAIADMGHAVGLHFDWNRVAGQWGEDALDAAVLHELDLAGRVLGLPMTRAVTFHNPPRGVIMHEPATRGYINAYGPAFMLPMTKYISDSNANWREGDPKESIRNGEWPTLQILTHPIWWVNQEHCPALTALERVLARRLAEIDSYMRHSNDLWRQADQEVKLDVSAGVQDICSVPSGDKAW